MHGLQTAALVILALVFVLRTPSAIREPRSRLSWLASGAGTVAFWLVTQAAISQDGKRRTVRWWPLLAALAAFTIPFLFITDRGRTDYFFIPHHANQTAMWLYASIYMGTIGAISFQLIAGVQARSARSYWLFRIGATAVILACLDEIIFLTTARFELVPPSAQNVLFHLFDPLFYAGVILIVAGIASFTLMKTLRALNLRHKRYWLGRTLTRHGFTPPRIEDRSDLLGSVYDHVIAIRDLQAMQQLTLIRAERGLVERSERIITRHLATPSAPAESTTTPFTTNGATS